MYSKQQIIEEIRKIAASLGTKSLTQKDFGRHSEISLSSVRYYFGAWNDAIKEAGLTPTDTSHMTVTRLTIDDSELLIDLIRLYNEYGKEPNGSLVNAKGKYSERPYKARWRNIKEAFLIAKQKFPEKVSTNTQEQNNENLEVEDIKIVPPTIKPKDTKKRQVVGEPIDFRGLRFAPINEQGVVYLFGMVSRELGFLIEIVRTEFPDCEGKRCFDKEKNQWEHVKIEFEFKSSNFKEHAHNEKECDIIVCWIHDWVDCPIEVLELRSTIKYLENEK